MVKKKDELQDVYKNMSKTGYSNAALRIKKNPLSLNKTDQASRCSEADISYNNVTLLLSYLTQSYKIFPRRLANNSRKIQSKLANAVKKARFLALIPYTNSHQIKNYTTENKSIWK